MNRFILVTLSFFVTLFAIAQDYKPVDESSKVYFSVKNFGINTGGTLSGLKGSVLFDPVNLTTSNFDVSVDVKTIDTDIENRDEHLRGDRYFDAEKYPLIVIRSIKINSNTAKMGEYYFTGTLTMHSITKNISFPFTATPRGDDYLFSGHFEINRLDFSVGEPSSVLGKTVKVSLSVLAKKS
ncbi:MAG: YceI family protein [Ginsengibacter sp.]